MTCSRICEMAGDDGSFPTIIVAVDAGVDTGERQGKGHDAEQRDCPDIFQQGKPNLRSVVPYDPDTAGR